MKSDEIVGVATGLTALRWEVAGLPGLQRRAGASRSATDFFTSEAGRGGTAATAALPKDTQCIREGTNLSNAMMCSSPPHFIDVDRIQVADFNMSRMRVVWGRIWRVLSSHFVEAQEKVHPNLPKTSFLWLLCCELTCAGSHASQRASFSLRTLAAPLSY